MRIVSFLIFVLCLFLETSAQREQGSWQDYLSYTNATKIAISEEKVFCATDGGLFYYGIEDNSVNKLSDVLTISDFGINTIAYDERNDVLVIAYGNSNIDLVYGDGTVINIPDIKNKSMSSKKGINAISFIDEEAYLACGFGIVVLNLDKNEVKDTYYIGEDGAILEVFDVQFLGQEIYAATTNGLLKANTNNNLSDYNNWIFIPDIPHSDDKFNHLEIHAGKLIANYTPDEWGGDEMYILNENEWEQYLPQIKFVFDMQSNGNYLSIASRNDVFVIDETNNIIGKINSYSFDGEEVSSISPKSAAVSGDGSIWIGDVEYSLVKINGVNFEKIFPNGPQDNNAFQLSHDGSNLWVSPGSLVGYEAPRFQRYGEGRWEYFNHSNSPELIDFHNIIDIEVDPFNENHFFVASWGGGLLEYLNDEFVERYTQHNSPLESAIPDQPDEPYVRINGLAFDEDGSLWMTNSEVSHNVHKLSSSGEWESFALEGVANKYNMGDLIVTNNGDKWMLVLGGHDAYVVDKTGGEKKRLFVTSYFSSGNEQYLTRMNDVYSIAEDVEGAIWIGTSKGVAVYNSPSRIWDSENFYASQPGLDLNDGIYHPLLETETVTAIAVDGANRKWFGTKASGVFLISETGENEILHFTAENSALLSNNILAITINEKNGEVFFGTDKGLISYQGEATSGSETYSNVYVYPNPVRETYDGPVTIAGLIENTDIKITDISGNLVYKTTSLGGQAIWDGTNLNGNRVKTGVYLVFCNDENGEETHITKLLFIN